MTEATPGKEEKKREKPALLSMGERERRGEEGKAWFSRSHPLKSTKGRKEVSQEKKERGLFLGSTYFVDSENKRYAKRKCPVMGEETGVPMPV